MAHSESLPNLALWYLAPPATARTWLSSSSYVRSRSGPLVVGGTLHCPKPQPWHTRRDDRHRFSPLIVYAASAPSRPLGDGLQLALTAPVQRNRGFRSSPASAFDPLLQFAGLLIVTQCMQVAAEVGG